MIIGSLVGLYMYKKTGNQSCVFSDSFGEWSECSKPCGGGTRSRHKSIVTADEGSNCSLPSENQVCNKQPCPVNCVIGDWGNWSNCSTECGPGIQTRTKIIATPAAYGGKECTLPTETRDCKIKDCPVDCVIGDWGRWSECSKPCGGGEITRTKTIKVQAANGGKECTLPLPSETVKCNLQACPPVDCVVSTTEWEDVWSPCSVTCGGGTQTRRRKIITPVANGGKECIRTDVDTQPCNTQPCQIDCVRDWTDWGPCEGPCGGVGIKKRTQSILVTRAANGGKPCEGLPTLQEENCNTQHCPIDCKFSDWGPCVGVTGSFNFTGTQTRKKIEAQYGGQPCPDEPLTKSCSLDPYSGLPPLQL